MVVQKIRSSINNRCSVWLRTLFPLFCSWVQENRPYKYTKWEGERENDRSPSPDPSYAAKLSPISMLPETIIKGLPMNSSFIKERCFLWNAEIAGNGTLVVAQRESLEQYNGQSRLTAPYRKGRLSHPKAECQLLPNSPSDPKPPFYSLLWDSGAGALQTLSHSPLPEGILFDSANRRH